MALDPRRDEEERTRYELECSYDRARELDQWKKAVAMCVAAGFLTQAKFDEALRFVQTFHK